MDLSVKVENGKLICLKQDHNYPVETIDLDNQVPTFDRLLCAQCLKTKGPVSKCISIKEAEIKIDEKLHKLETIKVWNVNCQINQLEYSYTLENKHTNHVFCLSLNESETALVSCGNDNKIILWCLGSNKQWLYNHEIQMDDHGKRISFINESQITWQQCGKGIIHIFDILNGQLIERPDLKFELNQGSEESGGLFPSIVNKQRQIIIQKHNRYVYILQQQADGKLQLASEPIHCQDNLTYGALTEDGEYLAIQNTLIGLRVYSIIYE